MNLLKSTFIAALLSFAFQTAASAQMDITTSTGERVQLGPNGITIQSDSGQINLSAYSNRSSITVNKKPAVRKSVKASLRNRNLTNSISSSRSVELPAAVAAVADDVVLLDNHVNTTLECNGNAVVINGNHCNITLTGNCKLLSINGNHNIVNGEAIGTVLLPGNYNAVTYAKGLGVHREPLAQIAGNYNSCAKSR
jgi:hypothetical protein